MNAGFQFWLDEIRGSRQLERIIEWCGRPLAIRIDNGPEYVSAAFQLWAQKRGIGLGYIQPRLGIASHCLPGKGGKPQQSAYIERYDPTVRQEWLGQNIFLSIEEAQEQATRWLWIYNNERPNMGIGGVTPAQKLKMAA